MRVELTTIDRICNRIQTIAETTFIPTAYAIAEISIIAVIFILLFLKIDPYYEGLILFAVISTLIIGILLLIKDMDNPFEVGDGTYADVDLSLLWNLEKEIIAEESAAV
jgi:O-antigen/teichoic acid export membrane protein